MLNIEKFKKEAPHFPDFIFKEDVQYPTNENKPELPENRIIFASIIRVKEEGEHGLWKDRLVLKSLTLL